MAKTDKPATEAGQATTELVVVDEAQGDLALLEQQASTELAALGSGGRPLPPPQMGYEYIVKTGKFGFYLKLGKGLGEQIVDGDIAEFILAGPQINNKGLFDEVTQKFRCQARNGAIQPWVREPIAHDCASCHLNQWDQITKQKNTYQLSNGKVTNCRDTLAIPMIYIGHRNDPDGPFELCYLIVSTKGLTPWALFKKQFELKEQAGKFKRAANSAEGKSPFRVVLAVKLTAESRNGNTFAVPSFSIVGDTNDPRCLHPDLYRKSLVIQLGYSEMLKKWGIPDEVDGDDITANSNSRATQAGQEVRPANEGNPPGTSDEDLPF